MLVVAFLAFTPRGVDAQTLSPLERLGKHLFFDTQLSTPPGLSCAGCHAPETGFSGPNSAINAGGGVHPGAVPSRFGNRMPPTVAYAGASPPLHSTFGKWRGGMFWDGHATGWTMNDPLMEQAKFPFIDPLEQNARGVLQLLKDVAVSDYAWLFGEIWGPGALDPVRDPVGSYDRIARAIAAYERSAEVNPFSSKYDFYLRGQVQLTSQERWGLQLFEGRAGCAGCHPSQLGANWELPLFTDFTYENIGMPRNPENPFYTAPLQVNPDGENWIDPGLGGLLAAHGYGADEVQGNWGKHKVPTLRNVDRRPAQGFVKAYGHNAYFKSLPEIVHFFNSRDVMPWPAPEVSANLVHGSIGNLGLTPTEEMAIVAFLQTLTDGYTVPAPPRKPPGPGDTKAAPALPGGAVELFASRPNPASSRATIRFALPGPAKVELQVYDLNGREVRTLASGAYPAGTHTVDWDGYDEAGRPVADGTYFYRLRAGAVTQERKLVWIR